MKRPKHKSATRTYSCLSCGKTQSSAYSASIASNKYCDNKCQRDHRWKTRMIPAIEEGRLTVVDSKPAFIRYLTERDGYKCNECGLVKWKKRDMILDIDHIDGCNDNNMPSNLRFLCPNCHRLTPTWGNKRR